MEGPKDFLNLVLLVSPTFFFFYIICMVRSPIIPSNDNCFKGLELLGLCVQLYTTCRLTQVYKLLFYSYIKGFCYDQLLLDSEGGQICQPEHELYYYFHSNNKDYVVALLQYSQLYVCVYYIHIYIVAEPIYPEALWFACKFALVLVSLPQLLSYSDVDIAG